MLNHDLPASPASNMPQGMRSEEAAMCANGENPPVTQFDDLPGDERREAWELFVSDERSEIQTLLEDAATAGPAMADELMTREQYDAFCHLRHLAIGWEIAQEDAVAEYNKRD